MEVRRELPRVLREIPIAESVAALLRPRGGRPRAALSNLEGAEPHSRHRHGDSLSAVRVREELDRDVETYLRTLVQSQSCPDAESGSAEHLLCLVLHERQEQALERLFRWLALIYSPGDVHTAYRGMNSERSEVSGNAQEFLETILEADDRGLLDAAARSAPPARIKQKGQQHVT